MEFEKGIAVLTFNRGNQICDIVQAVLDTKPNDARVIVCDDGSTDTTGEQLLRFPEITYIRGKNLGVGANRNRAVYSLRNVDFIAILEDDLVPTEKGWFETYMKFVLHTNIHHLCRVQNKFVDETVPDFTNWVKTNLSLTPIYGPTPRGDLTFISNMVIRHVGAFHPEFVGVGHAHGQWSDRVVAANLVSHPNKWIDIHEVSTTFRQVGDTTGGRWDKNPEEIQKQVNINAALRKRLGVSPIYISPFLP